MKNLYESFSVFVSGKDPLFIADHSAARNSYLFFRSYGNILLKILYPILTFVWTKIQKFDILGVIIGANRISEGRDIL